MSFWSGRLLLAGPLGLCAPGALFPQEPPSLSIRAAAGGHSNVFLSDGGGVADAFVALGVEGDGEWTWDEGRLLLHGVGDVVLYRERGQADEYFGFADGWLFHRLSPDLTLSVADFLTAFELRVLDRQGELLPGGRLRLLGNDALAGLDWRALSRTYLALEAGYRSRNYEERDTLPSIDSGEPYAGFRLTHYLPAGWSLVGEAYYGVQRYAEQPARSLSGTGAPGPGPPPGTPGPPGPPSPEAPELEIDRWETGATVQRRWGEGWRLEVSYKGRRDRDVFQGFQSYDQHGGEASVRLRPDSRTRLLVEGSVSDRRFQRQPVEDDPDAPLRRERFWMLGTGVEWPVMDVGGAEVALWGRLSFTRKDSNAPQASFDLVRGFLGTALWF